MKTKYIISNLESRIKRLGSEAEELIQECNHPEGANTKMGAANELSDLVHQLKIERFINKNYSNRDRDVLVQMVADKFKISQSAASGWITTFTT
jgi:hypothetical protein